MFPLKDDVETAIKPIVSWLIICLNVVVFGFEIFGSVAASASLVERWALVPVRFLEHFNVVQASTIATAMFLHGSLAHLAGNMLFLFVFGHSVEDRLGHARYFLLYFVLGTAAALTQIGLDPFCYTGMIGASGAISGVLGMYVIFFPKARVLTLIPLGVFSRLVYVPAFVFLFVWFVMQIIGAVMNAISKDGSVEQAGIAFGAHVGGFIAGMLVASIIKSLKQNEEIGDAN